MLGFVALLSSALAIHLASGPALAKTPAVCRECAATCANDVAACVEVLAAACPATPHAKAKRCLKKAKRQCRKSINGCCKDTCRESGAPVCCGAPTTTSTTVPGGGNACFTDLGDGTVRDSCTGLQWEQKTGERGVHVPGDLHNINSVYPWAGTCDRDRNVFCQPNANAAATCAALADGPTGASGPEGCGTCPGGPYDPVSNPSGVGPCVGPNGVGPVTTVWGWLNQLNASNFAGHNDWRLPSEAARNSCPPGEPNCATTETPRELETILKGVAGSCEVPCYYPIFGVPVALQTWSSSTNNADQRYAWLVNFFGGVNEHVSKSYAAASVRAVRAAP